MSIGRATRDSHQRHRTPTRQIHGEWGTSPPPPPSTRRHHARTPRAPPTPLDWPDSPRDKARSRKRRRFPPPHAAHPPPALTLPTAPPRLNRSLAPLPLPEAQLGPPQGPAPAARARQVAATHATAVPCPRLPLPTNSTALSVPRAAHTHHPPSALATTAPAPPGASTPTTAVQCPGPPPPMNSTELPVPRAARTHPPPPAPPAPLHDLELGALPHPGPRPPRLVIYPCLAGAPPLGEVSRRSGKARRAAHGAHLRGDPHPHPRRPQRGCPGGRHAHAMPGLQTIHPQA